MIEEFNVGEIAEKFYQKKLQKTTQTEVRIEKLITNIL